jgi:hypothetical protein
MVSLVLLIGAIAVLIYVFSPFIKTDMYRETLAIPGFQRGILQGTPMRKADFPGLG